MHGPFEQFFMMYEKFYFQWISQGAERSMKLKVRQNTILSQILYDTDAHR